MALQTQPIWETQCHKPFPGHGSPVAEGLAPQAVEGTAPLVPQFLRTSTDSAWGGWCLGTCSFFFLGGGVVDEGHND